MTDAASRRWRRAFAPGLVLLALLGLTVRVGYVIAERETDVLGDGLAYHVSANALADGQGYVEPYTYAISRHAVPAAAHPPAWTTLLAVPSSLGLDTVLEHQLFACVVGTAAIALVGVVGRRIMNERAGLIAAAIAVVYPNFWMYEREIQGETLVFPLAACTILAALAFSVRPGWARAAAVGALCGLLALTRGEHVLLGAVLLVPMCLFVRNGSWRARLGWLLIGGVALLLPIAPWTIYNTTRFENTVVLATNTGELLAISNCDAAYYGEFLGYWQQACARGRLTGDPSENDVVLRQRGLDYLRRHERRAPIVVLAREGRTWGVFRPSQQMRLDTDRGTALWVHRMGFVSYWLLAPLAVLGAVVLRRRRVPLAPFLAFVVTVAFTVALTFGHTRYRVPAEVSIVLLAAVGVDRLWHLWARRDQHLPVPPLEPVAEAMPSEHKDLD